MIKLTLDEEIVLIRALIAQAKQENDKRTIMEATKILDRLVATESKVRDRSSKYLHREQVMALGQAFISILGSHVLSLEGGPEVMTLIAQEVGENLAKAVEE